MTKKHDIMDGDTFEYTRNSYYDLRPTVLPEEIVYLSPDSRDELTLTLKASTLLVLTLLIIKYSCSMTSKTKLLFIRSVG